MKQTVLDKISAYQPKNGLDYIARFFISLAEVSHGLVTGHIERVALLAEAVANVLQMDAKAAFFGGLLHDTGKLILPSMLFDGHNISAEEYEQVKQHALMGAAALKDDYPFTSLCAGLHHAMYARGYGLTMRDFPESFSPATAKKVLQIAALVSICDFIEAYTHRATKIRDGSDNGSADLAGMLYDKYPDDHQLVDVALATYPGLPFWDC